MLNNTKFAWYNMYINIYNYLSIFFLQKFLIASYSEGVIYGLVRIGEAELCGSVTRACRLCLSSSEGWDEIVQRASLTWETTMVMKLRDQGSVRAKLKQSPFIMYHNRLTAQGHGIEVDLSLLLIADDFKMTFELRRPHP
jgi:hypothetical protein